MFLKTILKKKKKKIENGDVMGMSVKCLV